MSGMFAYHRPSNLPGVYVVQIAYEVRETRRVFVTVGRYRDQNCRSCGEQKPYVEENIRGGYEAPTQKHQRLNRYTFPQIDKIMYGDKITIEVRDTEMDLVMKTEHVATMQEITHRQLPFVHAPQGSGFSQTWEVVPLECLYLIDLQYSPEPFAKLFDTPNPVSVTTQQAKTAAATERACYHLRYIQPPQGMKQLEASDDWNSVARISPDWSNQ